MDGKRDRRFVSLKLLLVQVIGAFCIFGSALPTCLTNLDDFLWFWLLTQLWDCHTCCLTKWTFQFEKTLPLHQFSANCLWFSMILSNLFMITWFFLHFSNFKLDVRFRKSKSLTTINQIQANFAMICLCALVFATSTSTAMLWPSITNFTIHPNHSEGVKFNQNI